MANIKDPDLIKRWVAVEYSHLDVGVQSDSVEFERKKTSTGSLGYAVREFDRELAELKSGPYWSGESGCLFIVYGSGGVNRYYVMNNGDVIFSEYHSSKDSQLRAGRQGFGIFG